VYDSLAPGGVVFFRDYGVYDLPMLRFPPEQRLRDGLYARGDGTLAHFFAIESVRGYFRDAGFVEGGELGGAVYKLYCSLTHSLNPWFQR
jgi:hypothetical protein